MCQEHNHRKSHDGEKKKRNKMICGIGAGAKQFETAYWQLVMAEVRTCAKQPWRVCRASDFQHSLRRSLCHLATSHGLLSDVLKYPSDAYLHSQWNPHTHSSHIHHQQLGSGESTGARVATDTYHRNLASGPQFDAT